MSGLNLQATRFSIHGMAGRIPLMQFARSVRGAALRRGGQLILGALMVCTPNATLAQSTAPMTMNPLARDNFPIGSDDGALCQVQAVLHDPAMAGMFDRAWSILCRDAAQPVGRVLALRGDEASVLRRIETLSTDWQCAAPATPDSDGRAIARCTSNGAMASLIQVRWHVMDRGTLYLVEGVAAYQDALRLAIDSIRAQRIIPGTINVATTSVGDAAAMARIQVASLPADRALAEGYRRNNSGDYAEAAIFFEALERREPGERQGVDPTEFTLNRALQLSNLGDFAEAERLFAQVELIPTADIVQLRLRRNFRAMHALNQRDLDGTVAILDLPLAPIALTGTDANGALRIESIVAEAINSGSDTNVVRQMSGEERLTPQERATLIDAQADQLRGTTLRIGGQLAAARAALSGSLTRSRAVRSGRVTSIIRLRAQTMGEIALVDEADGRLGDAERGLSDAITLLETEYPETLALAAARAKYAAYLLRHDQADRSLTIYRQVIAAIAGQRRQLTGLTNQMAPYFRLLVDRQATDPNAVNEYFAASQLLVRPGVADTQAVLARELAGGNSEASTLFRQANNLSRDIERARIDFARLSNGTRDAAIDQQIAELTTRIANLSGQQTATLARLADYPQYRAVSADTLSLTDFAAMLQPGEVYAKLTIVADTAYGLLATPAGARIWRIGIDNRAISTAVDTLRGTISTYEGGAYQTFPYDAETAQQLFTDLFGPVANEVAAARHLIFEPDGALLRLPINLLITDRASVTAYRARASAPGADPFDMRGVAWLGRQTRVSTAVSALAFRNTRAAPASNAARTYLGLGNNAPVSDVTSVAAVRAASPDSANGCAWGIGEWNRPIAPDELFSARDRLMRGGADVVTGAAFTDRAVLARTDLADYRILHFATHGLVTPPRPDCPTRPALLTSFDTGDSDGLLSFDEIFDLRLNADLVILSACDTAGQASIAATRSAGLATGGGSSLDGLVRAFIGAGGRSVLASHWPAPDDFNATQRLIGGLFAASDGVSIADALGNAQLLLMDEAATSHPYYWAGFAIVGDGARPVIGNTAAQAATAIATPVVAAGGR